MGANETQHVLNDATDMFAVLQKFEHSRQNLCLTAKNNNQAFNTIILRCNWNDKEVILDSPISESGPFQWQQHTTIDLSGTVAGIYYQFKHLPVLASEGEIGQRLQFPRKIIYQQRRQTFRSAVPRALGSQIEINGKGNAFTLHGRILDLSVSGLACECDLPDPHLLNTIKPHQTDVTLSIDIHGALNAVCSATVREMKIKLTQRQLRIGLSFSDLCPTVQRTIDKAVADLQRLTRKNQTR